VAMKSHPAPRTWSCHHPVRGILELSSARVTRGSVPPHPRWRSVALLEPAPRSSPATLGAGVAAYSQVWEAMPLAIGFSDRWARVQDRHGQCWVERWEASSMTLDHAHFDVVSLSGSYDCVVKAAGEIDLASGAQLRHILRDALRGRPRTLTVDMAYVSFID
jgi:hypothetical protein